MSTIRLDGKVAVITGATQGIGRGIALDLASRGVHVIGAARNPEPGAEVTATAKAAGGRFTFVAADVSKWNQCAGLVQQALDLGGGRIDILVNNAGISRPHGGMHAVEEDDWRAVSSLTLESTIAMTRYVLPIMRAQRDGVIIHVASAAAISGLVNMGSYCMAKAAVAHHARVVAIENLTLGVRCNALIVSATETEAYKKSMLSQGKKLHGEDWTPKPGEHIGHDAAFLMQPEQIGRAVALLCLDEAREITGSEIALDRGFSAGMFNSRYNQLASAGQIPPLAQEN